MIPDATWRPCAEPVDDDGLVRIAETYDGTEYYVHRSGQYALCAVPVGGGWYHEIALLDRREGDERRGEPLRRDSERRPPGEPLRNRGEDRRDPETDWTRFVQVYGNGEADR